MAKRMSAETALQITSMANNAWSTINNYQAGDNDKEAARSLFLFGMDVTGFIISKIPYKNLFNPVEIVVALQNIQKVNERFLINVDLFANK